MYSNSPGINRSRRVHTPTYPKVYSTPSERGDIIDISKKKSMCIISKEKLVQLHSGTPMAMWGYCDSRLIWFACNSASSQLISKFLTVLKRSEPPLSDFCGIESVGTCSRQPDGENSSDFASNPQNRAKSLAHVGNRPLTMLELFLNILHGLALEQVSARVSDESVSTLRDRNYNILKFRYRY